MRWGNAGSPFLLPLAEERFEDGMEEAASLPGRRQIAVFRLLLEAQYVRREELERAFQVAVDSAEADAPRTRRRPAAAARRAPEARQAAPRPRKPLRLDSQPRPRARTRASPDRP